VRPLLSVAGRRIAAYKRHERASLEKAQTSMLVVQSTTLNNAATSKVPHSRWAEGEKKMPMRFNIHSAKTAAILILGTAGLAFTAHAPACGEPHGQLGLAALAPLAGQPEAQSSDSPSTAQPTSSVVRAFQLWSRGQPKAAIVILEPLLRAGSRFDDARDAGVAWNVLGHSYLDLDRYAEAKQAYQHAINILRPIASARAQYGMALDGMGMLEVSLGQRNEAKMMCEKARQIYAELGDSAGVASTSIDLAVIALGRNDFKGARRSLETAIQAQPERAMKGDDVAAMDWVKSVLALRVGNSEEAIAMAQQAIELWTQAHGPGYFLLSNGYLLRAQALAHSGDYVRAIRDAQHALAIVEAVNGRDTVDFLGAQIVYAGILRASGAKQEGSRMAKEASNALADLERRQCTRCTIDASGFR
jgi:tetratricopeptide (TPR) repeat protein